MTGQMPAVTCQGRESTDDTQYMVCPAAPHDRDHQPTAPVPGQRRMRPVSAASLAPEATPSFTASTFGTVWRRGSYAVRHVVFDSGGAGRPASAAAVATFQTGRQTQYPKPGNA
ncbi:MAG: hypothetical protein EPN49_04810 [Rhodanobacter sp.]|nr:MAG: hypothetical protein EPN49_04810 [Rhodanobacter sp.]